MFGSVTKRKAVRLFVGGKYWKKIKEEKLTVWNIQFFLKVCNVMGWSETVGRIRARILNGVIEYTQLYITLFLVRLAYIHTIGSSISSSEK